MANAAKERCTDGLDTFGDVDSAAFVGVQNWTARHFLAVQVYRHAKDDLVDCDPTVRQSAKIENQACLYILICVLIFRIEMIQIGNYMIRSYEAGDVPSLVQYANNKKVWLHLRDRFPHPYRRSDALAWLRYVQAQDPPHDFAIAGDMGVIGGIGLHLQSDVHRRSAEIGYWLGEPYWNRGITSQAVAAMTDFAFANFPVVRLYAHVFEGNPASERVLQKAGYELEGRTCKSVYKDGKLLDQVIYGVVRL